MIYYVYFLLLILARPPSLRPPSLRHLRHAHPSVHFQTLDDIRLFLLDKE
jgi:hypothetical protein